MQFLHLFKKKDPPVIPTQPSIPERDMRELLRENLKTIAVDVFTLDDPLVSMGPEEKKQYLKYFDELLTDYRLVNRIKYLINKQANLTMRNVVEGTATFDQAGAMNINGMGVIKNDIEKLASMYKKEYTQPPTPVDKFGI